MDFHEYNPGTDRDACQRIWSETGWLDIDEDTPKKGFDAIASAGRAWTAKINGEPECLVMTTSGAMCYQEESISFSGVSAVTTSRIARKQGLAGRLTAHAVAHDAANGAALSGLGMFEQGFYDKLGFGSGNYIHWLGFDPQTLTVPYASRPPQRLSYEDYEKIHASRVASVNHHGKLTFESAQMILGEQCDAPKGFGLGYFDESGDLTHHFWFGDPKGEHGPYQIVWMSWQNSEQFLELMGVLRNIGDQVRLVQMLEPAGIQIQDLLRGPLQQQMITSGSKYVNANYGLAEWQIRMNDLSECISKTHLACEPFSFTLEVTDPIEKYLDDDHSWKGISGSYTVTLGEESTVTNDVEPSAPILKSSVNAFSRMWLGCRPASGLVITAGVEGNPELIRKLDDAFRLPVPNRYWEF
jgi:hypothetical protein